MLPEPRHDQVVWSHTVADGMLSVPLVCYLTYEPEDRSQIGWSERLTLDKAFAGEIDVYELLSWSLVEYIQEEALANLKKSRSED